MGKICWINGQPYLVSLPRGSLNNQWDEMITFLGDDREALFHWREMFPWCQEVVDEKYRAVRGYNSARFWGRYTAATLDVGVGFRPVLAPLDPDTMKPETTLLDDIPDGTRIALTSLYMDGKVIAEPQNPTDEGDIADYIPEAEIAFGNRDKDPKNWLHVIKYGDLLWMDRNILKNISWEDLQKQGFTEEVRGLHLKYP